MDIVADGPVMEQAILLFEKDDLCMLMWALENHCDFLAKDGVRFEEGDHDLAYQIHQRIQSAWLAINEKSR